MIFRRWSAVLFASVAACAVAACDDGGWGRPYGYGPQQDPCLRFTSCGSCTPVLGCGWCGTGENPGGECHSGPEQCLGTYFTWTWEAKGCFPAVAPPAHDGGV